MIPHNQHARRRTAALPTLFLFLTLLFFPISLHALRIASGSSCQSACTGSDPSSSDTDRSQVVCYDSQFNNTANGTRFRNCINCALGSDYVDAQTGQSDLAWALYDLRYTFSSCVYGFDSDASASNPCVVSCTPIQAKLEIDLASPDPIHAFNYCTDGVFLSSVSQCAYCYSLITDQVYLASFLNVLQLGCQEQPAAGLVLHPSPSAFSDNPVVTSIGSLVLPTGSAKNSGLHGLSTGGKLGIGIAIPVALLILACVITVYVIRKRRQIKLRQRMSPWWGGHPNIASPHSPGFPSPPFTPYSPYAPTGPYTDIPPQNIDGSPITPLERLFNPRGFSEHRMTQMEMLDRKSPPQSPPQQYPQPHIPAQPQGEIYPDDQPGKLHLETNWADQKKPEEDNWGAPQSAYTPMSKEVSPKFFS